MQVSGEGVVGLFPELTPAQPTFKYQSCSGMRHGPGTMRGALTFVSRSTRHVFEVVVPTFRLAPHPFSF